VQSGGRELFQRLNSPAFFWSLVACCVYPVVVTVWQIARHRISGHDEDGVAIASGGRGIALFLLMFVAAIAHEQRSDVGELSLWLMVAVSAAVISAGALNVFGYWLVKGETVWLGRYLEGKGDVAARR
jgi:DMSO/TMAO reductase YedYZ heme-binding membrane subunit